MAFFNIPTDKYQSSYSGFDQGIKNQWLPQLMQSFNKQPSFGFSDIDKYVKRAGDAYEPAFNAVKGTFSKARESLPGLYNKALIPGTQNVLNRLSARGVMPSSMGTDAVANMGRNIAGDVAGHQTNLYGQEAGLLSQLASHQAGAQNQVMSNLLGSILGRETGDKGLLAQLLSNIGSYSESSSPLQPYQLMANLLSQYQ
jgi:hypothetical protein